ncbi:MAG: GntR family transcriptional regulator [Actinoallomurus sp.]|jgi:DNA-binding GntR family transcriptional regulator|nr:GntR family transcriptional regulator [Actinoallomurus sp.]
MVRSLAVHSLVDALVDSLRERILTGEIQAGAALTEMEVARDYDVARPTARTAIERLVATGLLHRGAHKSARVPVLGAAEIRDMYFARGCLEAETLRRLAATRAVPDAARDAVGELAAMTDSGSLAALVESDIRFHRELVDALASPRLSRLHVAVMGEMRLCMAQVQSHRLLRPEEIVAEHELILERVAAGDAEGSAAAGVAHLDRACTELTQHLDHTSGADGPGTPGLRPA